TWCALIGFGLATRVAVVILGILLALPESSAKSVAARSAHNDGMNQRHLHALALGSRRRIEPWYRWDAMWYADVSQRGYSYTPGFALTAAALFAWLSRRPLPSAIALAASSAARLTALSMSVGLVLEWAVDVVRGRLARRSAWLVALSGTLGTLLFFLYLGRRF